MSWMFLGAIVWVEYDWSCVGLVAWVFGVGGGRHRNWNV